VLLYRGRTRPYSYTYCGDNDWIEILRIYHLAFFLIFFSAIASLISWRALQLWRGKVALFTEANLIQGTDFFRVLRRYQAAVPSIAVFFWTIILTLLASNYAGIEKNRFLQEFDRVAQWPLGIVAFAFLLGAISIVTFGGPVQLVPPPMRKGKLLD